LRGREHYIGFFRHFDRACVHRPCKVDVNGRLRSKYQQTLQV
jgi:hypothetical protein